MSRRHRNQKPLNEQPRPCVLSERFLQPSCTQMERMERMLNELEKNCILMWDQVPIKPRKATKAMKENKIYDTALMFMVRGSMGYPNSDVWQQPLAYYFSEGDPPAEKLALIVYDIIYKLHDLGLRVHATVCNHAKVNCDAVKELKKLAAAKAEAHAQNTPPAKGLCKAATATAPSFVSWGIFINGKEVLTIFDVPQLLKGLRNTFIKFDVTYVHDGETHVASWKDIVEFYEKDLSLNAPPKTDFRLAPKLTDEHVYMDKLEKGNVLYAIQVFSQKVGSSLFLHSKGDLIKSKTMVGTARFCSFINQLFDSLNGCKRRPARGKLNYAVTERSKHFPFWTTARETIRSIKFIDGEKQFATKNLTCWLKTVDNINYLAHRLLQADYELIMPRNFGLEMLDEFLINMFHECGRNKDHDPTVRAFAFAFNKSFNRELPTPKPYGNENVLITKIRYAFERDLKNTDIEKYGVVKGKK